ncbi:hypothetical protein [Desulfosporosinus sp. SB140]|uniref:hypothetical protein n=1 Tax=Desulfosporosinus paludis TaxID=3115649 RepID=UPI003890088A
MHLGKGVPAWQRGTEAVQGCAGCGGVCGWGEYGAGLQGTNKVRRALRSPYFVYT